MASKTQIGAVIGVEGASKYIETMKNLARQTRVFKADMEALTTSFDKNAKSIDDISRQKKLLQKLIDNENTKLKEQNKLMDQVNDAVMDGSVSTEKWVTAHKEVQIEIDKTTANLNKLQEKMRELKEENALTLMVDAWKNTTSKTGEALKEIGGMMSTYLTAPIVAFGGISVKTFADIESAFTGVKKTVDWESATISTKELEDELRKLPLVTASTTEDIMSVAEAAGQLNVAAQDIPEFTRNVIMLADATNVTAQDGAISIAQFLNIMGEAPTTVDRFGSALVDLGNNTATDEASILALATRLASAGKMAGLSTPEILGLSAAMSSVGLTAEAGGTAMSTTMNLITKAVASGSEDLEKFAQITGTTSEEFANKWRTNAVGALQDLLVGFANLDGGSEELLQLMDELGWAGIRQSDTVRRLTLNYQGVEDAVKRATDAYETNDKLTLEASQRYATLDSQTSQLKESFRLFASSVGESIGKGLLPIIESLTTAFSNLDQWWRGLSVPAQNMILTITGLVAAIGPALLIAGNILIFVAKIKAALGALNITMTVVTTAISGAIAPILAVAAAVAAVIIAVKNWEQIKEFLSILGSGILEIIKGVIEVITGLVTNIGSFVWDSVKKLGDWVLSGILSLFENIVAKLMLFVLVQLPNFIGNVVSKVKDMGSSIKNTMSNLVSQALGWGRDLIGNIVSGITSRVGSLINSVKNIASTIWSYLHFSEPEKGALSDFHTWMPDMMKGLAEGIDANAYLVDNAISRVADSLGMGGQTTNYGGVVINLNVPQGTNGYQLVDEIESALAQRTVRRKAVFA